MNNSPAITKHDFLLFYDRPTEPCFMLKGIDGNYFNMPDEYFPTMYRENAKQISSSFEKLAQRTINVKKIELPDLSLPMELPYNAQFSLFVPKHRRMVRRLIDVFMKMETIEDLFSLCSHCQMNINPYLFNYCLSVAIMHRPDTAGVTVPNLAESFPHKFLDPQVFRQAREEVSVIQSGSRLPLTIPQNFTASPLEPEQRLAYWREDIGLNLHHWHWHLVYPFDASLDIVNKDRRGELFYYMHQQVIARYETERMCNGMARVIRFNEFREPIIEGYFSKLDSLGRTWSSRCVQTYPSDLDRPNDEIYLEISDLENWRNRIINAIESGKIVLPDGTEEPMDIDKLGNLLESSILSLNRDWYGDMHNSGHLLITYAHDPDGRFLEPYSVMGDPATSMRDPTFYRWHGYLDDIFNQLKIKLPPYTEKTMNFPGIKIESFNIEGVAGKNKIGTLWEQSTMELGRGLDFIERGSILARFTHLQHDEFEYVVTVTNTTGRGAMCTVRIFMGLEKDVNGKPFTLEEQRRLMMELDKFSQPIPVGTSTFRRHSTQSTVTIPYAKVFRNQLDRQGEPGSREAAGFDFCGCGWPQNLLVPKGSEEGSSFVCFGMLSDWNEDKIEQDLVGTCNGAPAYCGVRNRLYPDRRSMGYPFDRPAQAKIRNLKELLTPNMAIQPITITFRDITRQRKQPRYPEDIPSEDMSVDTSQ